jgi:DNA invertase Pin-like site-specific DNA recombinase
MLIGYARVSDASQNHDLQIDALRVAGCERIFIETASGTRTDRPELAKLLEQARPGDQICIWRLDRLARSLRHLIDIADDLSRRGIALQSLTESIDTASVSGRFLFHVLASLGQMEVEIVRSRTRAGLQAAAARGRRGGRPPVLDQAKIHAAKVMWASGTMTATEIAQQVGCAPSTLYRHLPGGRAALDAEAA